MDTARVVIMLRDSNLGHTREGELYRYVHIFHPNFGVEFERMFNGEGSSSLGSFEEYFLPSVLEYNVKYCNMLMIPLLRNNHWWCIVLNLRDSRVDVLDSIHSFFDDNNLEPFVRKLRDLLHSMLTACGSKVSVNEFEIKHHKMLQQALRDLGSSDIFVSKFMKLWDGRMTSSISKEMINVIRH
uniref:Ubiquitin-like protease family profile domain-containing protein n=1 Tax=Davidia involucrata TaxID=16924 RepID=A0A5B6ZQC1_DAVIN